MLGGVFSSNPLIMSIFRDDLHVCCHNLPHGLLVCLSCLVLLLFTSSVGANECRKIDSCSCKFDNGSIIDLTSLGSSSGPRWKDMTPTRGGVFRYYYNPCFNFKIGSSGECANGTAVCQVNVDKTEYHSCGEQSDAFFAWDDKKSHIVLAYHSFTKRQTKVTLVCSESAEDDKLIVKGETGPQTSVYEMTLISPCACPDKCSSSGLSFGSSLLIIFFVSLFLYLFLGIVYMHLVKGAQGWELIPNYEFWRDFPLLVRDGCVYVCSGCRTETSYERI